MTSMIAIALVSVVILFIMVLMGIHISFSLAVMSVMGISLMLHSAERGIFILATTTFEALRQYTFTVIPLFMIMGAFMSNSDIAKNLFNFLSIVLRKIPGGLAVATVFANAVFAAVTGVSIASAAIFSRISVPEMSKAHYLPKFSVGTVAGSSTLGMLIPPSLMFILYGTLAEVSIGKMFIAGFIPGILLALFFSVYVALRAVLSPGSVFTEGYTYKQVEAILTERSKEVSFGKLCLSILPTILLIGIVLGGIWGGYFTPTEAAAVGALGALVIGFPGGMGIKGFKKSLLETAASCSGILFLLITAQMYSRMLTISGLVNWLSRTVTSLDVNPYVILAMFMVIVILLGCILDSSSIMLIMVPLMAPIMNMLGFDMIWFGIITVLFVHFGLITPPFGICVFSIKSSLPLSVKVTLEEIFSSSVPFLLVMLLHAIIIIIFPPLATWLPGMM